MPTTCRLLALYGMLCLSLTICCAVVWGQGMGPETYGLVADMAMGTPASSRILAMGGQLSCLTDRQFSNPAFAGVEMQPAAGLRYNNTGLERGPTVTSFLGSYFHPLRSGEDGLQLTILTMSGDGGDLALPGVGAVNTDIMSNAWVVDYGRRIAPKATVGLSILGNERVGLRFTPPVGPTLFSLEATASYGARLGVAYEWQPGDFLGLLWNASRENVTTSGPLASAPGNAHVDSTQIAIGTSYHFTPQLLGALEYQRGRINTGSVVATSHEWHAGAEYQAPGGWALRAGVSDHSPTFGASYTKGRWRADYTFINDWKHTAVNELFGGSDTHSLQVTCGW
jgi:hypothetical protein